MLPRLDEQVERAGGEPMCDPGEAARPGENDTRLQHLQGCAGAFEWPEHGAVVVMQERDFAALPGLGGKCDRFPEVVQATPITKLAAG